MKVALGRAVWPLTSMESIGSFVMNLIQEVRLGKVFISYRPRGNSDSISFVSFFFQLLCNSKFPSFFFFLREFIKFKRSFLKQQNLKYQELFFYLFLFSNYYFSPSSKSYYFGGKILTSPKLFPPILAWEVGFSIWIGRPVYDLPFKENRAVSTSSNS